MIGEKKLKFKFNPTPTLAKLYEQQGLYQDALVIYRYLQSMGKNDFSDKVRELTIKLSSDTPAKKDEASLSEDVINTQTIKMSVGSRKISSKQDRVFDEVGTEKTIILPEYDSLINTLFNDEEKTYFKIVPSEEFFYNKDQELISIFTKNEVRHFDDVVGDEIMDKHEKDFQDIIEIREDISPEVTVEDFVNILYTYYTKDTKISEIKIGDLFLLLSTIKLENC